ncbi:MAG TPA: dephospho-CoA kinase [Sedimenticola sp.]|nr:dephospho-CoA kinase [Sedimenticola sp.]
MLIIGLTGGIGSGKTTVCKLFSDLGVPIIDADLAAREVVEPGRPGLDRIVRHFGPEVLTPDGALDRAKLRERVFSDETARKELERILHPLIRARMNDQLARLQAPYVILAIPLLLEAGQRDQVDRVLVIDAGESQQIARACRRDGQDEARVRAILKAQCSRKDRLAAADDVIYNTGGLEELKPQVVQMHNHYLRLAAGKGTETACPT